MRTTDTLRLPLLICLGAFASSADAQFVSNDTWIYKWGGTEYESLSAAEASMKASAPPDRQYLERAEQSVNDYLFVTGIQNSVLQGGPSIGIRIPYEGRDPRMIPIEPYRYASLSDEFSTEQPAIDLQVSRLADSRGWDCNIESMVISGWEWLGWASGGAAPPQHLRESYEKSIEVTGGTINTISGICDIHSGSPITTIGRYRLFTCPEYSGVSTGDDFDIYAYFFDTQGSPLFCRVDVQDEIIAKPITPDCHVAGNPCTVVAGGKVGTEQDYEGPGVSLSRSYDSSQQGFTNANIGPGWTHGYSSSYADAGSGSGSIGLFRSEGGLVPFVDLGEGAFGSATDQSLYISDVDSGCEVVVQSPSGNKQTYKRHNCSNGGALINVSSGTGELTVLDYTANKLSEVTGPFGHTLIFSYQYDQDIQQDRLVSVQDPAGNLLGYGYDDVGRLESVTYSDNNQKLYLYENEAFPYHLTGIIDETGQRHSTYTYDIRGRAVSSERAGGVGLVTLDWPTTFQSIVTTAGGRGDYYSHSDVGTLNIRKPVTIADDYGIRFISYGGGRGRINSQTNERGVVTTFINDDINRIGKTEATGDPLERTTNMGYDTSSGKVNLIRIPSVFQPTNEVKGSEK